MVCVGDDFMALSENDLVFVAQKRRGGVETVVAQPEPFKTNLSHQPRLTGWCGETDGVSTFAVGLGVVTRPARESRDPRRGPSAARIRMLKGAALREALQKVGHADLSEQSA